MAMKWSFIGILAVGATVVSSSPAPALKGRSILHERRDVNHELSWNKRDRAPSDDVFEMRIGLKQQNLHRGYDLLMDVSNPKSPNYGKYWTPDEIVHMFAPAGEAVKEAKNWLNSSGIGGERVALAASKGWLVFNATVGEAEKLLQTEYWHYEGDEGQIAVGCDEYHVPAQLSEHVDFVYPGVAKAESRKSNSLARRRKRETRQHKTIRPGKLIGRQESNCSAVATPECIAKLYKIPPADKAHPNNSMGIFQKQSWYQERDLDLFFKTYAPNIPQGTRPQNLSIDLAVWHYNENDTHVSYPDEADLDLDVAYPIIYPQKATIYQVDDEYYNLHSANAYFGLFNTFLDAIDGSYCNYSAYGETGDNAVYDPAYPDNHTTIAPGRPVPFDPGNYKGERMCGVYKPTNVISMSYSRVESTYSVPYQMRQCNEWMKLGLQGVTVVGSSGDSGQLANNQCHHSSFSTFYASHPGNCPYITSIGGVMLQSNGTLAAANVKDIPWATSGGFSQYFPRPDYQETALSTYFSKHDPGIDAAYNKTGRGFPDISALGRNVAVAVLGELGVADGTSASTPLIGAMFNRINEERLAVGKSTIGFVNPVLYANSGIFEDITAGDNGICGVKGFPAVEGWDPATGLGVPNYPKLLETFMALQ
ncbi:subtilisin-like protein [Annulohypoxylon maeteangense]|uniref:subtilisin-like protein n=1 Tax=Annulohypoxylon maeteangense TaxID=1927788 RepID=UPI0020088F0B|nr:subtilisin-like protein [Annulohypoxylon maeteangense]KAI0880916.1 subtilisin-like protein [Annulohypoxylon maeteangense]